MSRRSSGASNSSRIHMGHKKVHTLPPLEKKQNKPQRSQSLNVHVPDRQRIIGSPAPQAYRQQKEKQRAHRKKTNRSKGEFPTITLSAAESEDEDYEDVLPPPQDYVIEVGSGQRTASGHRSESARSGLSIYSLSTLGSAVELHRSLSSSGTGGLTPPPRVISMRGEDGNAVVTEWKVPGMENLEEIALEKMAGQSETSEIESSRISREKPKSNLPSLGSSTNGDIPKKYPPLEPIKNSKKSCGNQHRKQY